MATMAEMLKDFSQSCLDTNQPVECDNWAYSGTYWLGYRKPNYPMPAIRREVAYQIGDGDYWCGLYDLHLEETNPMHDDCFVMLWNARDDAEYMEANRLHLFGVFNG